jgi:hypothetical protein
MSSAPPHAAVLDPDPAGPQPAPVRDGLRFATFLVIPAIIAWMTLTIYTARGPSFTTNCPDPEYAYLFNALGIAEFHPPDHTDHPGTTVQTVGAVVLGAAHVVRSPAALTLRDDVLTHPEAFLRVYQHALLAIYACVSVAAGWLVFRSTRRLVPALIIQATPFFSYQAVVGLTRVDPEPLLLTAGIALSAGIFAMLSTPQRYPKRWAVGLGAVCGLGMATKVIFAPLALVPLVAFATMRQRIVYVLSTAAALVLGVLPMLPGLGRTLRWLWGMVTHTGDYGAGDKGLADWAAYPGHVWGLVTGEPLVAPIAVVAAVAGLLALRAGPRTDPAASRRHRTLLAVVGTQLALLVIVGKQPRAHYLVPAISLCGLTVALLWSLAAGEQAPGRSPKPRAIAATAAAVVLTIVAGVREWRIVGAQAAGLVVYREHTLQVAARCDAQPDRSLVRAVRSSSPGAALHYGNLFAGQRFSQDLRRLYPGVAVWDWTGINAFGQSLNPADLADPATSPPSFQLVASKIYDPAQMPQANGLSFQKTAEIGSEAFYTVSLSGVQTQTPLFSGFSAADGLGPPEGPYPAAGLDSQVRWGTGPRTTLAFDAGNRPMVFIAQARRNSDVHQSITVLLNGQEIGRVAFDTGFEFQPVHIRLPTKPGPNVLVLVYASADHSPVRDLAVLFRSLRIVPGSPAR